MNNKRISDMTTDECLVELTMREFSRLLSTAKRRAKAAQEAEQAVFDALENMCIDLDAPSNAENASTIEQAIACYLAHGEYTHEGIIKEVRALYGTQPED